MVSQHNITRDVNREGVSARQELLGTLTPPTTESQESEEGSEDVPTSTSGGENEDQEGAQNDMQELINEYERTRKWVSVNRYDIGMFLLYIIIAMIAALVGLYVAGFDKKLPDSMATFQQDEVKTASTKARKIVLPEMGDSQTWRKALESNGYGSRVFRDSEIVYKKGKKLYLVVAGHVFDVTSAEHMYGEGKSYHGFVGRDCTRGFITGKYDDENCKKDITDLEDAAILEIAKWLGFYFNHATYTFVGVLSGLYFDDAGVPTDYTRGMLERLERAEDERDEEADLEKVFPPCNMEWTAASGSRLWCTQKSGGIDRDWTGFPRQFTQKGKETRCACVNVNLLKDPRVKTYEGCPENEYSCRIKT